MAAGAQLAGRTECTCVISDDPITHAVTLVPCMHKANQAAAKYFFGAMEHAYSGPPGQREGNPNREAVGLCAKQGKNCPRCFTSVTAYYLDPQFQALVESGGAPSLPAQAPRVDSPLLPKTTFRRESDEPWEAIMKKFEEGGAISLSFVNINDNSLFGDMVVSCEKGKSPYIRVQVSDGPSSFLKQTILGVYLAAAGLMQSPQRIYHYRSTEPALLRVLQECSTIPEPELSFIKNQFACVQ